MKNKAAKNMSTAEEPSSFHEGCSATQSSFSCKKRQKRIKNVKCNPAINHKNIRNL